MTYATDLLGGLSETFCEPRGVRIRCFTGGEGRPLLLLHGFGGAAWNFAELAPRLAGRRLIVPDLPGHGASAPLPAASLAGFADCLVPLLDEPVDVVGHSLGGVVALRLAERHPELVRRLVLAAPAGISSSSRGGELFLGLAGVLKPARHAGRRADRIARSERLKRLVFGGLEVSNPALLSERMVHGFLLGPTIHTDALDAGLALARDDPRVDLERVRAPALVLLGGRDRLVPIADGFEYARRLRAPLRVIADCGHLLIGERPDVCARAALAFCA
ncbi:MAG TPA: alpha/beta fold hydrolase [Gaiellaceae bacterium]|jgi:pimeloyl-ACP methyl ester carboxylesterase|nr:alpha/beta fold hydrolase [Gaiellaceae bacterium]